MLDDSQMPVGFRNMMKLGFKKYWCLWDEKRMIGCCNTAMLTRDVCWSIWGDNNIGSEDISQNGF